MNQVYRPMAHGMHVLAIHLNWTELYSWQEHTFVAKSLTEEIKAAFRDL